MRALPQHLAAGWWRAGDTSLPRALSGTIFVALLCHMVAVIVWGNTLSLWNPLPVAVKMLELELVSGVDISARVESRPAVVAPEPAPAPVGAEKSSIQTAPSVAYPLPRSKPVAPASVTTETQDSAPQDTAPKDPAMVIAAYDQQISKLIAKHRFYPPLARSKAIKGNGVVRLRINRQGKIVERRMETSTGDKMLDEAALEMVRRANPLPAVPKNYPAGAFVEFLVPVAYQ